MADEVAIGALPLVMNPDARSRPWWLPRPALVGRGIERGGAPSKVDDLLPAPEDVGKRESEFRTSLRSCPAENDGHVELTMGALAATVMGMPPTEPLDPSAGFQLGMDSLMSVTLQRALSESLGESSCRRPVSTIRPFTASPTTLAIVLPELLEIKATAVATQQANTLPRTDRKRC